MIFDAIIPAGGALDDEFAGRVGTKAKALIKIDGESVLARTIKALKASGVVHRIVVIGSKEVQEEAKLVGAHETIPEGTTGPENIFRGLDALEGGENPPSRVLMVTCDLPFLTPELIHTFVESCPLDKNFCVPLIAEKSFHERFPGTNATFVALNDDVWTTGCIYMFDAAALRRAKPHIEKVFENRKSKMGMAKLLGPMFVFKWLTKSLSLADVERKIESLIGCSGKAIVGSAPEFSFDIDYVEDYEYAVAQCAARPGVTV